MSLKMATNANPKFPFMTGLESQDIIIWNDTTGVSKTATIEIVSDGASALNNNQVWMEIDYLGSSATPLATRATNAPNFVTAAAAVTSSTALWPNATGTGPNGSSTWQIQKLQISFTPQLKGPLIARVFVAKASWTVYVDPMITVT
jgi:aryl-phospho-beta-D-glucosidase BglC (GH1 family)